jgi:uncharacterized iron-regulated protein
MRILRFVLAFISLPAFAHAGAVPEKMAQAQVIYLGEIHDNPVHHETQAALVTALRPSALVYEMLTAEVAASLSPADLVSIEAFDRATGWSQSGWPDLNMYWPIVDASDAAIYGAALPRDQARTAMKRGVVSSFGDGAALYGLASPLPADQQAEREALQMAAHCDALPESLLPGMVALQRLRDAMLARAALVALDETGGPVVVITGNGHARADWGAPSYVAHARPEVTQFTLAQTEDDAQPDPAFDMVLSAPPVDRPDPCAAFK